MRLSLNRQNYTLSNQISHFDQSKSIVWPIKVFSLTNQSVQFEQSKSRVWLIKVLTLTNQNVNKVLPNFGFGAFYYTDKFYEGLSVPNLLESFHFEKQGGQITRASETNHYFITSGYVFDINYDVKLKPSMMVKAAAGAPLSIDFSGNVLLYDKFEFGLSYRLDESVSALVNIRARKNLRVGYAYDYTLTALGDFNSGSHEIFLLFNFDFERNKIKSPRFF